MMRKEIIGNCELYLGDCLEIMPTLGKVDAVIADLPYGTTKCSWDSALPLDKLWGIYKGICEGDMIFTASQPFTSSLILSNVSNFKYELIWDKAKGMAPGVAKYRPMPSHESILIFRDGKKNVYNPQWGEGKPYVDKRTKVITRDQEMGHKFGYNGQFETVSDGRRHPLSVIKIPKTSIPGQHPTEKPVNLMKYLIDTYSNEGQVILDNCMGCGSTGIAAQIGKRKFIGIEISEKYFDIACRRIQDAVDRPDMFIAPVTKVKQETLL